jgi:hypothetical protein
MLALDGTGAGTRETGVGFLDHMLDLLARHGRIDLDVTVSGDLETGGHHTVEDTGIVLGQALDQALADRAGIHRYGHAIVPMDEARALCAIDVSGRPYLALSGELPPGCDRRLRTRAARGVLSRRCQQRQADDPHRAAGSRQRAPHDRGRVQGIRPGAARRGRAGPERERNTEHEGSAVTDELRSRRALPAVLRDFGSTCVAAA